MDILNWILLAFSTLSGGTAILTFFAFRKQQKRFKTAEAFGQEVAGLQAAQQMLHEQIKFQASRIDELQKLVVSKDNYISQLSTANHTLEVKHSKNKSAINKAYECRFCEDKAECPVLKQRAANEEAYLNQLNECK